MCSTCNHTKYIETENTVKGRTFKFLKADETHTMLDIRCDLEGRNFKIGDFTIYHCPTCGRKLES